MGRGNQFRDTGGIFHVTHRCHNQAFLLKFARDRDAYRAKLREHLDQFEVGLLDYCLTSNHVHLLLDAAKLEQVRKNLQFSLEERIAQHQVKREPCWTESLAVGSSSFVERSRRRPGPARP